MDGEQVFVHEKAVSFRVNWGGIEVTKGWPEGDQAFGIGGKGGGARKGEVGRGRGVSSKRHPLFVPAASSS